MNVKAFKALKPGVEVVINKGEWYGEVAIVYRIGYLDGMATRGVAVFVESPTIGRQVYTYKDLDLKSECSLIIRLEPIYKENDSVMGHEYLCPTCGVHLLTAFIGKEDYKHCFHCGSPLIWPTNKR